MKASRSGVRKDQVPLGALVRLFAMGNILLLLIWLAIPGPARAEDSHTPLEPIECPGKRAKGDQATCFILHLPADWTDISGRSVEVPVMRFAPLRLEGPQKKPLLVLMGGPGQSAIWLEKALAGNLRPFRGDRELILMDQRGTGPFNEDLVCAKALREGGAIIIDDLVQCAIKASDKGYRLSDYTSAAAAQDYRALRYALKIDQWAVMATSYGARVAQDLMAIDAKGIERVLFNAPLFNQTRFFDWSPLPLVESVIEQCVEATDCAVDYPDLYWDYQGLPFAMRSVPLADDQPPRGLIPFLYRMRLQSLLSRHRADEIPADITRTIKSLRQAIDSDEGWVAPSPLPPSMKRISLLLNFSTLCAEDIARMADLHPEDIKQPLRVGFYREACTRLETVAHFNQILPDKWDQGTRFDKPVLILNGGLDAVVEPTTPEAVLPLYKNSRWFQLPYAGHDVVSRNACARSMAGQFLEGAKPEAIDSACLAKERITFLPPKVLKVD